MSSFIKQKTERLSSDVSYKRPKKTLTDKLQNKKDIIEKLKGYKQVENVSDLPIGTHVRYITWKNNAQRFCMGGWIRKMHDKYVILETNRFSWSVQRYHFHRKKKIWTTIFFKKQTKLELCEHALRQQQLEIEQLKQIIKMKS